ncbi:MAG: DUF4384 domain-containing protein [Burkholderiaceae bacterium]
MKPQRLLELSMRPSRRLGTRLGGLAVTASLAACAATAPVTDYDKDVAKRAEEVRSSMSNAPEQTRTGFGPVLRCMDFMFLTYGVQNLSVLIEDIPDATRKVNASGKDMIISAVSQMSRRSRAVKLVAFSVGDATLGAVIGLHTRAQALENPPDFAIRGSVSQFDENLARKQGDIGVGIGAVSAGVAAQGSASVLALDLSVISTKSLELVPGATSKNSVLVMKQGEGADGEVNTRKFGLNFSFTLARSEGTAQALRTLSELATIELFGKLTKIPYWTCLGADESDPGVQAEITDWWETLAADPPSLVAYLQQQMRARGLYGGRINGQVDDSLLHAIGIYQQAMGGKSSTELDFEFFRNYLRTDHSTVQAKARELLAANPGPAAASQPPQQVAALDSANGAARLPLVYVAGDLGPNMSYKRGQPFKIDVAVDSDSYLYCYLLDAQNKVNQFYPNPVQTSPAIAGGTRLQFPGDLPFTFVASPTGERESIACFAALQSLGDSPLDSIPRAESTDELTSAFRQVAGPGFGVGVYDVNVQ